MSRRNKIPYIFGVLKTCVIVVCILLTMVAPLTSIWVTGSLVTSGVKSISKDCGQTYGAEVVFSGNWFCPTKEEEE